jgi:hypothetical protein
MSWKIGDIVVCSTQSFGGINFVVNPGESYEILDMYHGHEDNFGPSTYIDVKNTKTNIKQYFLPKSLSVFREFKLREILNEY